MKTLLLAVLALLVLPATATEYQSLKSAQAELFPMATHFRAQKVALSRPELEAVLAEAGSSLRGLRWRQWQAWRGDELLGHVLSDAVIGKHELFDYAVAFDRQGRIVGVRVLSYRESQGGEVRALSCKHLTDGIRRLTYYVRRHLLRESNS